jgi:hypothetical protein
MSMQRERARCVQSAGSELSRRPTTRGPRRELRSADCSTGTRRRKVAPPSSPIEIVRAVSRTSEKYRSRAMGPAHLGRVGGVTASRGLSGRSALHQRAV